MESRIKFEKLYFYYLSLKSGLINLNYYDEKLNELFLEDEDQDGILLELQFCTANLEKTIFTLNTYLFDKIWQLDFQIVGIMLVNEIKKQYNEDPNILKELTHKLYIIWTLLPNEVAEKEPFIKLNSIDDSWSWNGKEKVIDDINWLLNYYPQKYNCTVDYRLH